MYKSKYQSGLFLEALSKFYKLWDDLVELAEMVEDDPDYPEQPSELLDLAQKVGDLAKYFLSDLLLAM